MKIIAVLNNKYETVGYVLSENSVTKRVSTEELVRINPDIENAIIKDGEVHICTSEQLPIIEVNKTIQELEELSNKIAVLTGVVEPIRYKYLEEEIILCSVAKELKGKFRIPQGVTKINRSAFSNCFSITSIIIPDSVKAIGDFAFFRCLSLENIIIPSSVKEIDNSAFCYCSSMTSMTFEGVVEKTGVNLFNKCEALTSIKLISSTGDYSEMESLLKSECKNVKIIRG